MHYTLATSQSWLHQFIFRSAPTNEASVITDGLFMMIFWFSVFFFVVLMALMVYWTIKYRRRPGVPAPQSPHHNTPLEIVWTVVPSSALLVIFLLGFHGYMAKMVPPTGALELRVTASMWNWSVTYPAGEQSLDVQPLSENGKEYPIFYVPEGTDVSLRMSSQDVIHAFWVPDFRTKMDVYPNRYTGYTFRTPVLGIDETVHDLKSGRDIPGRDLWVFCAEYCGKDHSRMAATLRVVPQAIYDQWLVDINSGLPPVELGKAMYKAKGCNACHTLDGSPGTGPSWKNLYGYEGLMSDGTTVLKDDNYIRESVYTPQAKIVAGFPGSMPSFQGQLDEKQLEGIIAYMQTLSDKGGSGEAAPGDGSAGTEDSIQESAPEPSSGHDGGES